MYAAAAVADAAAAEVVGAAAAVMVDAAAAGVVSTAAAGVVGTAAAAADGTARDACTPYDRRTRSPVAAMLDSTPRGPTHPPPPPSGPPPAQSHMAPEIEAKIPTHFHSFEALFPDAIVTFWVDRFWSDFIFTSNGTYQI
jgi:hypothetical protein